VAHAFLRAASPFLATFVHDARTNVEKNLDTAGVDAYATI
jgi:hypothetical protein